jgi:hypothetical protein
MYYLLMYIRLIIHIFYEALVEEWEFDVQMSLNLQKQQHNSPITQYGLLPPALKFIFAFIEKIVDYGINSPSFAKLIHIKAKANFLLNG